MGERIKFKSPRGEIVEASLFKTALLGGCDTGSYLARLALAGEALETVKAQVEEFLLKAYGSGKAKYAKRPFKMTKDGDKTFITFRARAVIYGRPRPLGIYDSSGAPITDEVHIGPGSIVRVSGTMTSWSDEPGVSFYMDAVQVINFGEPPPSPFGPEDTE